MRYLNIAGYVAIPLAFLVHYWIGHDKSWEPATTFFLAALGVIPLAHMMGEATEHLAEKTGPTWGGLINATFGNAAELIIAIIALTKGLNEIVKASLTGSILGNLLLVGGAAMVAGGWRRESQRFNPHAAETNAGLLVLAVGAMLLPAIFHHTLVNLHDVKIVAHEHQVSLLVSVILLAVYALGLIFTLRTHAHIFSRPPHAPASEDPSEASPPPSAGAAGTPDYAHAKAPHTGWSVKKSVLMLLLASAGIAVIAELLVKSAETMAHALGWSEIFVGVILLAIIGNAAEHSTAIMLALRDDMDTAMTITYQSSLQIALFATPFVVLVSALFVAMGMEKAQHLDLMFSPMEVVAVTITVGVVVVLGLNGQTNWFEGAMLLALYAILGIAFFFVPGAGHESAPAAAPTEAVAPATQPVEAS